MHFLITGGTGFIGSNLIRKLKQQNHEITILTRDLSKLPANCAGVTDLAEIKTDTKLDVIINLAGSSIDRRWSKSVKQDLVDSRINTTKAVVNLVERLAHKPSLMISASAIGYYGSQSNAQLDESSAAENTFTHQLCNNWETEARRVEAFGTRLCIARFGVVLGTDGGALKKMLMPFKLGLGGKLGSGEQYFSWIHIDDVTAALVHLIANEASQGIYNFTAPNAISNQRFTSCLGSALNRPTLFAMPEAMIKIIFGEMGVELLLKGQNIYPKRLLEEAFQFEFRTIDKALSNLLGRGNDYD